MSDRFDRNVRFFGAEGQAKIRSHTAAVIGIGGLGTHVVQQLSLLGMGRLILIDPEELETSNKNRYVGVYFDDPVPGTSKVDAGKRLANRIDPSIHVTTVFDSVISNVGFEVLREATVVFGCLDRESVRLVLTEYCSAYKLPYFDLATEINTDEPLTYGGRVCISVDGTACLMCLGVFDVAEAQRELLDPTAEQDRRAIYGVNTEVLGEAGPAVVSLNGVVASLAVTEFIAFATALRAPYRLLTYYGHAGKVTVSADEPYPDCYYCRGLWGLGDGANLTRHVGAGGQSHVA